MARAWAHRAHHLDRDRILAGEGSGRKGHSFFGYFCLSLLFFPLALIMAYMVQGPICGSGLRMSRRKAPSGNLRRMFSG